MPRKLYDPSSKEAFKISRTGIENYIRCPRCFYMNQRLGISQPGGYPFTLNSAVDHLLKKEFDIHRAGATTHPLMKHYGVDAVPFQHEDMDKWRHNFTGIQHLHKPTNLFVFGAIDDVWVDPDGQIMVVDYKATSKEGEVTLDADWQDGYKRQMEIYQWLLRQNGFQVSDTGYFVYANGKKDRKAFDGKLEFDIKIIPYTGSDKWVEKAIMDAKECLDSEDIPECTDGCDFCKYQKAISVLGKT